MSYFLRNVVLSQTCFKVYTKLWVISAMLSSSVTIVVVPTITAVTANITDRQFPYIHQSHLPILFYVFQRIRHIPPFHLMILSLLQYNPMTGRFQGMDALYYIFPLKKIVPIKLMHLSFGQSPQFGHREKNYWIAGNHPGYLEKIHMWIKFPTYFWQLENNPVNRRQICWWCWWVGTVQAKNQRRPKGSAMANTIGAPL